MNFTDILDRYRVDYQTSGRYCRPGWVQMRCPHCDGSSTDPDKPCLGFNIGGAYLNCWVCGRHRLGDTLAALTRTDWRELKPLIDGLDRPRYDDTAKPTGKLVLPSGTVDLLPAHRRYLRGRGLVPADVVRLWGVQSIGMAARLAWRLFIPIHHRGRVVSWTTRSIAADATRRYIAAGHDEEALPHKSLLYGEDYVRQTVVVVEGPVDVWRIGPGAVCTFGTGISPAQVAAVAKYPRRVICFDASDDKAQQRARGLLRDLAIYGGDTYNVVLDADDPGQADDDEIAELRQRFLD